MSRMVKIIINDKQTRMTRTKRARRGEGMRKGSRAKRIGRGVEESMESLSNSEGSRQHHNPTQYTQDRSEASKENRKRKEEEEDRYKNAKKNTSIRKSNEHGRAAREGIEGVVGVALHLVHRLDASAFPISNKPPSADTNQINIYIYLEK